MTAWRRGSRQVTLAGHVTVKRGTWNVEPETESPLILHHCLVMVPIVARKEMAAVIPGYEKEMFNGSRVQRRIDRSQAGISNGAGWEPGVSIGVIGRIEIEVALIDNSVKGFHPADRVDDGGITLQPHAALQPIVEDG